MNRREKVALSLLKPINPSLIIILGVYTVVWGLWILNPFWDVFASAPLYSQMAHIANEYVWGGIAITAGLIITRGATKPSYSNIQIGAIVAFFHWFTISILYFVGDWMNTGGITALMLAVYSGIVWLNIKVNRHHFDHRRRRILR